MRTESTQSVAPYEYTAGDCPEALSWPGLADLNEDAAALLASAPDGDVSKTSGGSDPQQCEQDRQRAFAAGRQQGLEEGRGAERETQTALRRAAQELQKETLGGLIMRFEAARDLYLQEVEREVVELALAVATRILRREVQMDPLLLTGAVRVALGQLASTTRARLHVPLPDKELWSEAIDLMPHLTLRPEVIAEEGLTPGDCRIETEIGSVDIGLRAQLGEIERGFFDRTRAKVESSAAAPLAAPGPDAELV